jgi:hypothetical protein
MNAAVRMDAGLAEQRSWAVIRALRLAAVAGAVSTVGVLRLWVGHDSAADDWFGLGASTFLLGLSALSVVAGILWLRWFQPLYAAVADVGRARFTGGGLWFWAWVIPICSLFLPKYLVNDVWWAPDPPDQRSALPRQIQLWWGFWVAAGVVALVPAIGPLSLPLMAPAALFGAGAVRTLTDRALLLAARAPVAAPEPVDA